MTAEIKINISLRAQGTGEVQTLQRSLAALKAENRDVAASFDRAEAALKKADQAFAAAQKNAQALTQSEIRAAVAARDYAGALAIVDRELKATRADTVQYNQLLGQQAQISRQAASAAGQEKDALGGIGSTLTSLASGYGALKIATTALDWTKQGGQIAATEKSFNNLAKSVGTTGTALLTSLRTASRGYVDDAALMAGANKAILLGGQNLANSLPQLLRIATAASDAGLGDTAQLYNDLVSGLARGSTEILDNIGITVSAGEAQKKYAASLGISADKLTEAQKKQALLNDVLEKGNKFIGDTGSSSSVAGDAIGKLATRWENLKNTIKETLALGAEELLTGGSFGLDQANAMLLQAGVGFDEYRARMEKAGLGAQAFTAQQYATAQGFVAQGERADAVAVRLRELGETLYTLQQAAKVNPALDGLLIQINSLAAANPNLAATIQDLIIQYNDEAITFETVTNRLAALSAEQGLAISRADEHKAAIQGLTETGYEWIAALEVEAQKSYDASIAQQALQFQTDLTRESTLSSIDAYFAAGNGLDVLTQKAYLTESALRAVQLAQAQTTGVGLTGKAGVQQRVTARDDLKTGGIDPRDQAAVTKAVGDRARDIADPSGAAARQRAAEKAAEDFNRRQAERTRQEKSEAERAAKARYDLLTDQQQLAQKERELNSGTLSEAGKLEHLKEIRDLRAKIANEQEREAKAAEKGAKAGVKAEAKDDRAREQEAAAAERARYDLMSDQEKLAQKIRESRDITLPESQRIEAEKEILDLNKKITDERAKQYRSALDAIHAQVEDRKDRLAEDRDIAKARRVLANPNATADQKKAAQIRLDEIDIDRRIRADDIAQKQRDAGGTTVPGTSTTAAGAARNALGGPFASGGIPPAGRIGTEIPVPRSALAGPQGLGGGASPAEPLTITIPFAPTFILDGKQIAAELVGPVSAVATDNVGRELRIALIAGKQGGVR